MRVRNVGDAIRVLCAMLVCQIVLLCVGCGDSNEDGASESPSATSSLAAQAKTDLGRRILEDGEVTAAEWAEVKQALTDCIHEKVDANAVITWHDDHSSAHGVMYPSLAADSSEEESQAVLDKEAACQADTDFDAIAMIQDLGSEPDEDTTPELVQCLVSKGLVDSSMTVEEYKQIISDPDKDGETFGKYEDRKNPQYDEQKAQEWWSCQEGESTN